MTVTLHDWPEGLLCSADHTNLKGSMQLLRNLHKNSPFDSLDATIPTCNYLGIYTRAKVTNWPSSRLLIHVSSPLGCSRSLAARRTAWDLFLPKCKKIWPVSSHGQIPDFDLHFYCLFPGLTIWEATCNSRLSAFWTIVERRWLLSFYGHDLVEILVCYAHILCA